MLIIFALLLLVGYFLISWLPKINQSGANLTAAARSTETYGAEQFHLQQSQQAYDKTETFGAQEFQNQLTAQALTPTITPANVTNDFYSESHTGQNPDFSPTPTPTQ